MSSEMIQADLLRVRDMVGRLYVCSFDDCIGKGGQGQVLRARGDRYTAVKIACDEKGTPLQDAANIERYQRTMKRIRSLPVPSSLRLSMPVAVLQDAAGYVMLLLGRMESLARLIPSKWKEDDLREVPIPGWLREADEQFARLLALYARTGGFRMRLDVLRQVATTLARLHANGIVFGDLSLNNIQVSTGGKREAWLIDVDNLCYEGFGKGVYTPGYCAPEVYTGKCGVTRASDAYAFALLAFELLSMLHPFYDGMAVVEDEWDGDAQHRANSGELPWIGDTQDSSNNLDRPHPLEFMLSRPLRALFQQTFCKESRDNPHYRPPLWMWCAALAWSQDMSVSCPACGMGWIPAEHEEPECPFCHAALPLILEARAGEKPLFAHEVLPDGEIFLSRRLFGSSPLASDRPLLRVCLEGERLELSVIDENVPMCCAFGEETLRPCPPRLTCSLQELRRGIRFILDAHGAWEILLRERLS